MSDEFIEIDLDLARIKTTDGVVNNIDQAIEIAHGLNMVACFLLSEVGLMLPLPYMAILAEYLLKSHDLVCTSSHPNKKLTDGDKKKAIDFVEELLKRDRR